jgi:hypothetical protein
MRTITRTVEIDAPPHEVWTVLTDGPAHADWNPFIPHLAGRLEAGRTIDVRIAPPGGRAMTFSPTVTDVQPERRLAWLGRLLVPGLFDGAHSFTLEPLPGDRTRLTQSETFRGALVPFTGGVLRRTEAGFAAMNEALRQRVAERHTA